MCVPIHLCKGGRRALLASEFFFFDDYGFLVAAVDIFIVLFFSAELQEVGCDDGGAKER